MSNSNIDRRDQNIITGDYKLARSRIVLPFLVDNLNHPLILKIIPFEWKFAQNDFSILLAPSLFGPLVQIVTIVVRSKALRSDVSPRRIVDISHRRLERFLVHRSVPNHESYRERTLDIVESASRDDKESPQSRLEKSSKINKMRSLQYLQS